MKAKHSKNLKLDPTNARRHPQRNKAMIRQSLEEIGGFRSIGVDGENIVRAGNGVFQQAQELGLKVRIIDAKPDELIAVRRLDLSGKKAIRAALLDNRTSETSEWDTEILAALDKEFLDGLWDENEFAELFRDNEDLVSGEAATIETFKVKPAPEIVWYLIGIPFARFGEARDHVIALESMAEISVQSSRPDEER